MLIVIIAIWIYCFILSTTPYYGLGGYTFYRQGGICIAPLPPESWWLVVYIVYSTIPIMLLMAMILATFTFAVCFAWRQQRARSGPNSASSTGVNHHAGVSRTVSAPETNSHNHEKIISTATAEQGGKNQSRTNCCCFCEFFPRITLKACIDRYSSSSYTHCIITITTSFTSKQYAYIRNSLFSHF